jgi:phosphonate transport system substrate-binding protein
MFILLMTSCNQPQTEGTAQPQRFLRAGKKGPAPGSAEKPIVMAFVPSTEAEKIVEGAQPLMKLLEAKTGLKFKDYIATSYIAVVEAMGQGHVDVAWLPTLAYVLANDRNGATVKLKAVRDGKNTYYGIIITRKDSGINTLADLKGKTFAFVDAASASGHLYPRALLMKNGIDPDKDLKRYLFAGGHDSVVMAVFKKNVAAGASYEDARDKFKDTMPKVLAETKVIAKTDPIPSDTVSFSSKLPPELVEKITQALVDLMKTPEGKKAVYDIYQVEDLVPAADSDYDTVREVAKVLGLDLEKQVKEGAG